MTTPIRPVRVDPVKLAIDPDAVVRGAELVEATRKAAQQARELLNSATSNLMRGRGAKAVFNAMPDLLAAQRLLMRAVTTGQQALRS